MGAVVATPSASRRLGQHRHPPARGRQHADLGEGRCSIRRASPSSPRESGLDYYYDRSDRALRATCSAPTSRFRANGLPLIVHTRRCRWTPRNLAEKWRRCFPGADPLLHRLGTFGRTVLDLGLTISSQVSSLSRTPQLQEFARNSQNAFWGNRQPFSRRFRTAKDLDRRCAPHRRFVAGWRGKRRGAGAIHPQFYALSGRRREAVVLGSGTSTGVPRIGKDGANATPRAEDRRSRLDRSRGRGTGLLVEPRPTCASNCSTTKSTRSTRCSGPTTMPITATASTTSGRCASAATRRCPGSPRK